MMHFHCGHRTLGTPNEQLWPGVSKLPDFKPIFPVWKKNILEALVQPMEEDAIDLLNVSLNFALQIFAHFVI
jgi:hypothetical protein